MLAPMLITILSLGDSYTIGEGVAKEDCWPVQLASAMRSMGVDISDPVIIAKTGWTTDELKRGIEAEKVQDSYAWVTLLVGVNNQYRGRDVEEFRKEFRELLAYAIKKANGNPRRVLVLSIPDWGVTPFAEGKDREKVAREIDAYNAAKRQETEKLKAHFIDITDISREASEAGSGLLADDGLHPSGAMYGRWVERILPIMRAELGIK
jgi:lysophospholipase L1-like esterase